MKLPSKTKRIEADPLRYTGWLYGSEKIGKTTFLSSFPEALFLSTEPGTKGLEIYEIEIHTWNEMRKAIRLLEKEPERFKTVIIDTADRAYDKCLACVCEERGLSHPSDEDDFGKTWHAIRSEFTDIVQRIIESGRGLWFTSHAHEMQIKTRSGEKYTIVRPTASNQATSIIRPLVDWIFYAEYVRDMRGEVRRILITSGDDRVMAGFRKPAKFPAILPLLEENGYEMLVRAFKGAERGIDAKELLPSRDTTTAGKELLKKKRQTRKEVAPGPSAKKKMVR